MQSKLQPLVNQRLKDVENHLEQHFYQYPGTGILKTWTLTTVYWAQHQTFNLALTVEAIALVIINAGKALCKAEDSHFKESLSQLKKSAVKSFSVFIFYIPLLVIWLKKAKEHEELRNKNGWLPIHFAAAHDNAALLQRILDQSHEDLNKTTFYKAWDDKIQQESPLHIAARCNHLQIAQMLLKAGATAWLSTPAWNFTPIDAAVAHENVAMIHLFAQHVKINALNTVGMAPLHYASTTLYPTVGGNTHFPRTKFREVIEELVKRRADVELPTTDGSTPLMLAAYDDQPEAIDALLQAGAKPNIVDGSGRTALHRAAESCKINAMNARDSNGQTILHYAAQKVALDVVQDITNLPNIDFTVTDAAGRTPYQIVKERFNRSQDNGEILAIFTSRMPQRPINT
jgi:ankyrin repeat protein